MRLAARRVSAPFQTRSEEVASLERGCTLQVLISLRDNYSGPHDEMSLTCLAWLILYCELEI